MEVYQKINHLLTKKDTEMTTKFPSKKGKTPDFSQMSVVDGLRLLYTSRVLPMERHYLFEEFHSPPLEAADFATKPTVLMVGQYSTGKTTFIKYLLERDFPDMRIGP